MMLLYIITSYPIHSNEPLQCIFLSFLYEFVLIAKGGIIIVSVQTLYRRAHNNVYTLHDTVTTSYRVFLYSCLKKELFPYNSRKDELVFISTCAEQEPPIE